MIGPETVAETTDELLTRLPDSTTVETVLVLENDLLGRAVLALLWSHRAQLHVYLVTEDTAERNVLALHSGITSVRNAPSVELISTSQTEELASTDSGLVWAMTADRTATEVATILRQREDSNTHLVFFDPLRAFGHQLPNQAVVSHELVLRDITREHARFLNFFGDRYNPRDLYERSKYPNWIDLPQDFVAGIPKLLVHVCDAESNVVDTTTFDGVLKLGAAHILQHHRATVELAPILEVLGAVQHDITLRLQNPYANPTGQGALALQVHLDERLMASIDIATSDADIAVQVPAVRRQNKLNVSVVALKDNPRKSWARATQTQLRIQVHPAGTHPVQGFIGKTRAWLNRRFQRRHTVGTT